MESRRNIEFSYNGKNIKIKLFSKMNINTEVKYILFEEN